MKKVFCLLCGLCLLFFSGCSLSFNSQDNEEVKMVWEYKEVVSYGDNIVKDYRDKSFSNKLKELNDLGQEGWELVGVYSTIETVFPNFGNEGYHTGMKSNTRTSKIVYLLKRQVQLKENKNNELK